MTNLKKIIYLSSTDYNTLITTGSVTIGGHTYTQSELTDYEVKVVFDKTEMVDEGIQSSANYQQITYYEVGSNTAHHAKIYIEEID